MHRFRMMTQVFLAALADAYKKPEDRELGCYPPLGDGDGDMTEDFTAMLYAVYVLYKKVTGEDIDFIGFSHVCNRLAVQLAMEVVPDCSKGTGMEEKETSHGKSKEGDAK